MTIPLVLKRTDIPDIASVRLDDEDKDTLWKLIQLLKPKKISPLFKDGLKALLEKEQKKT